MPSSDLITPDELTTWLRVSLRTIERRVKAGVFPTPIFISKQTRRWRRGDIEDWLKARRREVV
jgi:predicted DNA-binding transcriptional regulator AlpA